MSAEFLKAVRDGGKVRVKDLGDGRTMAICFKDGKYFKGEIQKKRQKSKYAEVLGGR